MNNTILLYGLGGASKMYKPLAYYQIFDSYDLIDEMKIQAARMRAKNPCIARVYAIVNRHGLRRDFMMAMKGGIEEAAIFKDLLERNGMEIKTEI